MQVKKVLLYTFCACVFIFAGQVMADEFFDDFEDPDESAEKWDFISGKWQIGMRPQFPDSLGVEGGPQDPFDANVAIALAKLPEGKGIYAEDGLVIETEFVDTGGGGRTAALLMVSYVSEEEAYYTGGYTGGWQIWCVHKLNPTPGLGFTQRQELVNVDTAQAAAGPKAANDVFILKAAVEGDDVVVYADDKEGARHTFPGGVPRGRVGLLGVSNNGNYHWVRITGPFRFMAVDHTDKLSTTWGSIKAQLREQ